MKPYVAKARLLKLADLLQNLPRRRFDFSTFCSVKSGKIGQNPLEDVAGCGTTACALGWAPSLPFAKKAGIGLSIESVSDGFGSDDFYVGFTHEGGRVDSDVVAGILFGLSESEFTYLFHPESGGDSGAGDVFVPNLLEEDATPKALARHIRKFVARKYG